MSASKTTRVLLIGVPLLAALVLGALILLRVIERESTDESRIRVRWSEMERALHAGDQERVRSLMIPNPAHLVSLAFVRPLTPKSQISVGRDTATVCAEPGKRHFLIFQGGHVLHLKKLAGEWFFTGKVNID
jgi:hypothetical protein